MASSTPLGIDATSECMGLSRPPLLVFGLTGQLGEALRRAPLPLPALALSRTAPPGARRPPEAGASDEPAHAADAVRWRRGALDDFSDASPFDIALSLGPLDAFARAVAEGRVRARRIVAFGSTSVHAKANSPDPAERALARRLADAEAALFAACARSATPCLVLRPTLVWGLGRDATVSRVIDLARRWPLLPLPLGAPGLRQPVHAVDLADAVRRALAEDARESIALDLPGGEALAFGEMLARAVAAGAPGARVLPLPWRLARLAASPHPRLRGIAARLDDDLVFASAPAVARLGWAPRGFAPSAADFPARQTAARGGPSSLS